MGQIRLLLVDDNEDSLDILRYFIDQITDFEIIGTCRNGDEFLKFLMQSTPDVVLIDINMPIINGIDAMKSALKIKKDLQFIFVTSYDEYAVKAFELSAVDYVVKPIEKTRLYLALDRVRKKVNKEDLLPQRLIIRSNGGIYFIAQEDIFFIEKVGKKSIIRTLEKNFETNENIGDILNELKQELFCLSHRSYIINLAKISHIIPNKQTYLVYFQNYPDHAHISKLKIDEIQSRLIK